MVIYHMQGEQHQALSFPLDQHLKAQHLHLVELVGGKSQGSQQMHGKWAGMTGKCCLYIYYTSIPCTAPVQLPKALILTSLQISPLHSNPNPPKGGIEVEQSIERTCYTLLLFPSFFFATSLTPHQFVFLDNSRQMCHVSRSIRIPSLLSQPELLSQCHC